MSNFYHWEIVQNTTRFRNGHEKDLQIDSNVKSPVVIAWTRSGTGSGANPSLNSSSSQIGELKHQKILRSLFIGRFLPLLKVLRVFGRLPVSVTSENKLELRLLSWSTLWTIFFGGLSLLTLFLHFLHHGLHFEIPQIFEPSPVTRNDVVNKITNILTLFFSIEAFLQLVIGWAKAGGLVTFWNNWIGILEEYDERFLSKSQECAEEWQKVLIRWTRKMYISVVGIATFFHAFSVGAFLLNRFRSISSGIQILFLFFSLFVNILLSIMACFLTLSEDYKIILMFKMVQHSFKMIKDGIEEELELHSGEEEWINEGIARGWKSLIHKTRGQHEVMCNYQSPSQLLSALYTIFILTTLLYALYEFSNDPNADIRIIFIAFLYLLIRFIGILVKAHEAEKITLEENRLANLLIGMRNSDSSELAQIELQMMVSMLIGSPSKVNYSNYMHMSKKFLRNALSQSLTYLVVLCQFTVSAKDVINKNLVAVDKHINRLPLPPEDLDMNSANL